MISILFARAIPIFRAKNVSLGYIGYDVPEWPLLDAKPFRKQWILAFLMIAMVPQPAGQPAGQLI